MENVRINFNKTCGKVKPMHAVNNGPVYKFASDQRITNIDAFRDAGIPYARTHDASFCSAYGGEHTVDVHAIFPNFSADAYDEASYDFACTDEYLRVMDFAGVKPFYRLGSKIEHTIKKYGTLPPPDFKKWAVICEHIIRHYNEGWANGFHYNIEYWEIWNEADLDPDNSTHKRTWGGTAAQFYELFNITLSHLKKCFPNLKIGGPAVCNVHNPVWLERFFNSLEKIDEKPDFFSWHIYSETPKKIFRDCKKARELLDSCGLTECESILNEWNYVKGWENDAWLYSLKAEKSLKGASFTAATMCGCQYEPLDMLMYYDARPCGMNGMFCTDWVCEKLKGYYPFLMFGDLYRLGEAVEIEYNKDGDIYAVAAKGADGRAAVMLTHFEDDDNAKEKEAEISLAGISGAKKLEIYTLDAAHDMELTQTLSATEELKLTLPLFTTVLIKIV